MTEAKVTAGENTYHFYNKYFNHQPKPDHNRINRERKRSGRARIISTGVEVQNDYGAVGCSECNDKGYIMIPVKIKRGNATRYVQEKCTCQV
jgi:hypothetical protein